MTSLKLFSWNVNGLRAVLKKGALQDFIKIYQPDILCLQETKAKKGQAEIDLPEYEELWNSAERAGYSGTAIFTKQKPLSITYDLPLEIETQFSGWEDQFGDARKEGRVLTAEFSDFYLVNVYVPNEKSDLERLKYRELIWDPALLTYLQKLDAEKPVLICGDFNVAHQEIDLARPKQNEGNAGFTKEGRQGMTNYLKSGFIDTWRTLHPNEQKFSWWSYRGGARTKNVGWRIDYFLASKRLQKQIKSADVHNDVIGSDHCPISIEIEV
ncbi:MAG: exodeoxyribonuclease III [Candidatus Saccharibacteria bacterium]|nr:exodeoxyribonuclease III [Candidatus Saccharibacteria bacterium]